MFLQRIPLQKQIEIVFQEVKEELLHLTSGIVFVQIRNNAVGKFGVKHFPIESKGGKLEETSEKVMTDLQWRAFKQMAVDALRMKRNWTHGEIFYEFALKKGLLCASVTFESNYNMANYFNTRSQLTL